MAIWGVRASTVLSLGCLAYERARGGKMDGACAYMSRVFRRLGCFLLFALLLYVKSREHLQRAQSVEAHTYVVTEAVGETAMT